MEQVAKSGRNANHPTSKPLDLLGYPIGNSTQENGVVMDTFGGRGSTLIACEQMNRICYTMELDEKYASVILRRYVEDTENADDVYVVRDGKQIAYAELVKELELNWIQSIAKKQKNGSHLSDSHKWQSKHSTHLTVAICGKQS